jgi:hypothetical protein
MEDKLKALYQNLVKDNYDLPAYDVFKSDMGDPIKSKKLHDTLKGDNYDVPDYNTFTTDLGISEKKKVSPLDLASKGQTILSDILPQSQDVSQTTTPKVSESTTLQSQSISGEATAPVQPIEPPKQEAKTLGEWVLGTVKAFDQSLAGVADAIDHVQTMATDAVNQIIFGKEDAVQFKKMREEGTLVAPFNSKRPFEAISDAINYAHSGAKPLPTGKGAKGVLGSVLKGSAEVIPDIITAIYAPEVKLPAMFNKIGLQVGSKFGMVMGAKSAITGAENAQQGTTLQKVEAPILGAIEGYMTGWMFDGIGARSAEIGKNIADKVIPKVTTQNQAINKALVGQGGSMLANAIFFGGYGNAEELLRTGKISPETFATNAGMGIALGLREPGRLLLTKGLNSFIATPKEAINRIIEFEQKPEELTKTAEESINKIESGTSTDIEADLAKAKFNANLAGLNAIVDEIQSNKDGVVKMVNESDLEPKAKELIIDKINEVDADNDPKIQATKDVTAKIEAIDKAILHIRNNKSWDEARKEVESASLKEEKLALKEKAIDILNKTKPREKKKGSEKPQKPVFTEINSENISEIEKNHLDLLNKEGGTPEQHEEVKRNLEHIKQSVNERAAREKNPDTMGEYGEDASARISEIRPEEIERNGGEVGRVFDGRREGNRSPRITPEEQVTGVLAPNGEKSNLPPELHTLVRTPEFKAKFGDWQKGEGSLVLDANGEPLVIYSGKRQYHIRGLDPTKGSEGKLYFTGSKSLAAIYAQFKGRSKQPVVYRGFLKIGAEDLANGKSQINTLHDNQQEFMTTSKDQFIPTGVEEIPKLKKGGQENAERNGEGTDQSSQQTQGLEQGTQTGVHIRDNEKDGVETPTGEEVKAEYIPLQENNTENTANNSKNSTSEPLSPESGSNPKEPTPPENGQKTEKPDEREKSLLTRLKNAEKLSEPFKKHVEEKGMTYESIPNDVTYQDVDALMAETGTRETENAIFNTTNDITPRVRALTAIRLITRLDSFADEALKEGDTKGEYDYRLRSVKMAEWIDNTVREWGRGIQMLASDEVNATLAPKTQVIMSKRAVRRQRDAMLGRNKKDITKKADSMRKANEESVDEALQTDAVKEAKGTTDEGKKKPVPPDRIKVIREKRKVLFDQLKESFKKPSEPLSSSVIGLNKDQIEIIGNIVANYVEEGFYRTQDLTKKLIKDLDKYAGIKLSQEEAEKHVKDTFESKENLPVLADKNKQKSLDAKKKRLQKRLEELQKGNFPEKKPPEETDAEIEQLKGEIRDLLREKYKEDHPKEEVTPSELLASRVERMLQDPKTPKDDPVKQMVETLFKKIQEKDTKEKVPVEKKTVIDKIKESIGNKEKYASVWEEAKQIIKDKIDTNDALAEEQKQEQHKRIDAFYNEVIGQPFSEGQVGEAVKKEIKDLDVSIDKVVRDHYTVYDATKRTLQEKLIEELGIDGENAKMIADAVSKEFDKIAIAKKQAILKKGITAKEAVRKKTATQVWEKLIEASNLGAFSDAEFAEAYADKWGFPTLTDAQSKDIANLADRVYKAPEGYQKYEAIQDLLKYQAKLPGIDKGELGMSVWYNFILSGVRTQWKNIFANSVNATMELGVAALKHPTSLPGLVTSAWRGSQRGRLEAGHVLKTGYNPIKGGKVEAPTTTELLSNKNVLSLTKYVTRWMVAADMFTYAGLKEMRSYELAMNMAREQNASAEKPSMSNWAKANEILNNTTERRTEAEKQAEMEGLTGNAARRRTWEIMEQGRSKEMIEDAANFASRGTFNHPTEGILGLMTDGINSVIQKTQIKATNPFTDKTISVMPLKFVIPFTKIIANVANVGLDYFPPTSLARAATGHMGTESMGSKYREYTKEERQKLLIKASIGIAAQIGVFLLSHHKDENGEPLIEITANGTGDFQKNNELKEKGWQPYSIRIGKKWISYQYTPLVLTLAPMGIINDAQKYQADKIKDKDILSLIGFATYKNLAVFSDMTWASTVNSLMGALSTGDVNKGASLINNLATSTAKGFIYPKLLEQTVQAYDAIQKNPRKEAQGLIGKITRDLPIVRKQYNPMLNVVGEPVYYDLVQMAGKVKHDPFWDYVDKHNVFIGKPMAKTPIYDDINKVERGMTDDEYYEFIKKSGQEIKQRITDEVMTKDLSEDDIKKEITNIKTEVRNKFKTELFGWGQLRQQNPSDWKLLRDNDALQVPKSSQEITIGKDKIRLGEKGGIPTKELEDFNNIAIEEYRKRIINYLRSPERVKRDKAKTIPDKEISVFEEKISGIWSESLSIAKDKTTRAIKEVEKTKGK